MEKIRKVLFSIIKNPLTYILIISFIFQRYIYSFFTKYTINMDSISYLVYNINKLNTTRTPVYPIFCRIIKLIFNNKDSISYLHSIVNVQKVFLFLSIIPFYYILKKVTKNKALTIIFTLMYSLCPYIFLWNTMILTESISILEMIILIFFTVSYLDNKSKLISLMIPIQILIMVMTKPAYIYLIIIYFIYYLLSIILYKKNKEDVIGFVFINFVIIIVLIYSYCIYKSVGIFSLTTVSSANTTSVIIDSNMYKYGNDDDIIMDIDSFQRGTYEELMTASCYVNNKYMGERITNFNKYLLNHKKGKIIEYTFNTIKKISFDNMGTYYSQIKKGNDENKIKTISNIIYPVPFILSFVILFYTLIYIAIYLVKNHKFEWIMCMCFTMIIGNMLLAIIMSPYEVSRLCTTSLPVMILLISYHLKILIRRFS